MIQQEIMLEKILRQTMKRTSPTIQEIMILDIVVFVMQADGKVKKQKVKTDIQDINYIEITDGLKEGQEVVTGPYDVVSKTLKDGDKVKVVPKSSLFDMKK